MREDVVEHVSMIIDTYTLSEEIIFNGQSKLCASNEERFK